MKKNKNKNFLVRKNAIERANLNACLGVYTKGGKTLNSSIDLHAIDKELKLMKNPDYVMEHEPYLQGHDTIETK